MEKEIIKFFLAKLYFKLEKIRINIGKNANQIIYTKLLQNTLKIFIVI